MGIRIAFVSHRSHIDKPNLQLILRNRFQVGAAAAAFGAAVAAAAGSQGKDHRARHDRCQDTFCPLHLSLLFSLIDSNKPFRLA